MRFLTQSSKKVENVYHLDTDSIACINSSLILDCPSFSAVLNTLSSGSRGFGTASSWQHCMGLAQVGIPSTAPRRELFRDAIVEFSEGAGKSRVIAGRP